MPLGRSYYWAEIITGGTLPTGDSSVYLTEIELFDALTTHYNEDVAFGQERWLHNTVPTGDGIRAYKTILWSGVEVGTSYRISEEYTDRLVSSGESTEPSWVSEMRSGYELITGG